MNLQWTVIYRRTTIYDHYENEVYMTEIQLKNIVERLQGEEKDTRTDAEVAPLNGVNTFGLVLFGKPHPIS